jgi:hypothetical protein
MPAQRKYPEELRERAVKMVVAVARSVITAGVQVSQLCPVLEPHRRQNPQARDLKSLRT